MRSILIICIVLSIGFGAVAAETVSNVVTEPTKQVPVIYDVDVVVAGGGISGVFAAIAAAREGASTVVIDRFGYVGGNIGPGMCSPEYDLLEDPKKKWKDIVPKDWIFGEDGGLSKEFADRFFAVKSRERGKDVRFMADSYISSYVAMKMLKEAGVEVMLSTYIADPILECGKVVGVFVENKSGRQAVKAKVVIDATGEADLVRRAGAAVIYPQKSYNEQEPHSPTGMGLSAVVGGIDPLTFDPNMSAEQGAIEEDLSDLAKISCAGFQLSFDPDPSIAGLWVQLVRPHEKVDAGNGQHISILEADVRMYVFELVERFREKVPGCKNAYLMSIAPYLGVRGGPCIEGEYTLTFEDCVEGKRFDDVMYVYGQAHAMKINCQQGECKWTDVPYRVMIPKKLDGLMAVGRSASCKPDTLLRIRNAMIYMGQAGGTAAAMAVKQGINPRDIDVKELQKKLLAAGYYLGDEDRLKELNLNVASKGGE